MRGVQAASGISALDRLLIAPLIIPAARDLRVSVGVMALAATGHFLSYGAAQTLHGLASDRFGRIRSLRVALTALAVANVASAAAPTAGALIVARCLAGAASAGLVPGALVYLADALPPGQRDRAQIGVGGALGIGTAASLIGGLLAGGPGWRWAFFTAAIGAGALASGLRHAQEPPRIGARPERALRHVWASASLRRITLLAIPEGAAVFGFIAFFPAALQHGGYPTAVAGLATGASGVGLALGTVATRRLHPQVTDKTLAVAGAAVLTAAYLATTAGRLWIILAAAAAGIGQSALHSTLQRWAAVAVEGARGTATAFFATGAFAGAAAAAAIAVPLTGRADYMALFALASAATALTGGVIARGWVQPRRGDYRG